jgi:hypothetical protein
MRGSDMAKSNDLVSLVKSARKNFERNQELLEAEPTLKDQSETPNRVYHTRYRSPFFEKMGKVAVAVAAVGSVVYLAPKVWGVFVEQGCDNEYLDSAAGKAKGEPCYVPVMAGLQLPSVDKQRVVPDIVELEMDTDTKAIGSPGDRSYRQLEIEVTGSATANYAQTGLASQIPADQVNALTLFAIYNDNIGKGGAIGQTARQYCEATTRDMLLKVRSNPQWFVNDSFPASIIGDPNLLPHASEGGVDNFELVFVSRDPLPVLSEGSSVSSTNPAPVQKRELTCGAA